MLWLKELFVERVNDNTLKENIMTRPIAKKRLREAASRAAKRTIRKSK
jgi:hypothetical protein